MIGCLIVGGLAIFGLSRLILHHRWHRAWGGCRGFGPGGGWSGPGGGWRSHHHFRDDDPGNGRGSCWFDGWDEGDWSSYRDLPNKRIVIRRVLEHLRATPEQSKRIGAAVAEFGDEMKGLGKGEVRRSRREIADALRGPTFDGIALGEQFARHDTVLEGGRKAFVGLFAKVHDVLEPDQRTRLADLVDRLPRV